MSETKAKPAGPLTWSTDDAVSFVARDPDGVAAGLKIVRTPDNRWVVFRQANGGWESPSKWGAFGTTAEAKEFAEALPPRPEKT